MRPRRCGARLRAPRGRLASVVADRLVELAVAGDVDVDRIGGRILVVARVHRRVGPRAHHVAVVDVRGPGALVRGGQPVSRRTKVVIRRDVSRVRNRHVAEQQHLPQAIGRRPIERRDRLLDLGRRRRLVGTTRAPGSIRLREDPPRGARSPRTATPGRCPPRPARSGRDPRRAGARCPRARSQRSASCFRGSCARRSSRRRSPARRPCRPRLEVPAGRIAFGGPTNDGDVEALRCTTICVSCSAPVGHDNAIRGGLTVMVADSSTATSRAAKSGDRLQAAPPASRHANTAPSDRHPRRRRLAPSLERSSTA